MVCHGFNRLNDWNRLNESLSDWPGNFCSLFKTCRRERMRLPESHTHTENISTFESSLRAINFINWPGAQCKQSESLLDHRLRIFTPGSPIPGYVLYQLTNHSTVNPMHKATVGWDFSAGMHLSLQNSVTSSYSLPKTFNIFKYFDTF